MSEYVTWLNAFDKATTNAIPERLIRTPRPEGEPYTAAGLNLPERMDGNGPLVSVIIPTYKDSYCLPSALQSVGNQNYRNIELVLVDSSGVDWVQSLAESRNWIRYRFQEPRSVAAARNTGIDVAEGTYIALLDADDYWHPKKLDRQISALEEQDEAAVVFSDIYFIDFRSQDQLSVTYRGKTFSSSEMAYIECLQRHFAHTSSLVFSHTAIGDQPFQESLGTREDIVFKAGLFKQYPPVHVADPLVIRRFRSGSLTDRLDPERRHANKQCALDYLLRTHPELEEKTNRIQAQASYGLGRAHLELNNKGTARTYLMKSIWEQQFNYKALALYIASLLPVDGKTSVHTLTKIYDYLVHLGPVRQNKVEILPNRDATP